MAHGAESYACCIGRIGVSSDIFPDTMTSDVGGEGRLVRRRDESVKSRCNSPCDARARGGSGAGIPLPDTSAQEVIAGASQSNPNDATSLGDSSFVFHSLLG